MKKVEPKVFLIAYTELDEHAVEDWLSHVGGIKVLDHLNGDHGEMLVELAGRNCYRSFDVGLNPNISKVRTDSEKYHENILKVGHGSILEHATATFAFEDCSRVFTHEAVRHRAGTAMCLSGDTLIYSERFDRGSRAGATKRTIKSIYERSLNSHGKSRLKLFKLRCLDEQKNEFITTKIKSVWQSGVKPCFKIILEDEKSITCSKHHRFLTPNGWKALDTIVGGLQLSKSSLIANYQTLEMPIAVNGVKCYQDKDWFASQYFKMTNADVAKLCNISATQVSWWAKKHDLSKRRLFDEKDALNHNYKDKNWLYEHYRVKLLSIKEISNLCGTTQATIRNWIRKFGFQSTRMPKNFIPWNKDKKYKGSPKSDDEKKQISNRMKGSKNPMWKGGVAQHCQKIRASAYSKRMRVYERDGYACKMCHSKSKLTMHHIVPLWSDPDNYERLNHIDNLITLCCKCHLRLNGKEMLYVDQLQKIVQKKIKWGPIASQPEGCSKFLPKYITIKSIEYVGEIDTYDIETTGPHNFVANGIITHNSQESLRYVRLDDLKFWIPDVIADNPEALKVFEEVIEKCEWGQKELAKIFDIENVKSFHTKKQLTSAFRRVAPIGLATGLAMTFNLRSLRWVIQMRTAESAEVEIRKVFCEVYEIARKKWKFLFQDFEIVDTNDGLFEAKPGNAKV